MDELRSAQVGSKVVASTRLIAGICLLLVATAARGGEWEGIAADNAPWWYRTYLLVLFVVPVAYVAAAGFASARLL